MDLARYLPRNPLSQLAPSLSIPDYSIPYIILVANLIAFKFLRALFDKSLYYYVTKFYVDSSLAPPRKRAQAATSAIKRRSGLRLFKLLIDELISTVELCADCSELNVVYERHGSLAYGLTLSLLTYSWINSFGEAHTTPAYLAEEYAIIKGSQLLQTGEFYVRILGQAIAIPLAWRFAKIYWNYELLNEHKSLLIDENCHSSLTVSTLNGTLIELICCFLCRLIELSSSKLAGKSFLSENTVAWINAILSSFLVVLALDYSGGYFNPVLAASLEFGCKGIQWYQHALVFWLGPFIGHILARLLYNNIEQLLRNSLQHGEPTTARRNSRRLAAGSTAVTQRQLKESSSGSERKKHSSRKHD